MNELLLTSLTDEQLLHLFQGALNIIVVLDGLLGRLHESYDQGCGGTEAGV
ncbi:MAG: hypothetical protein QM803_07025 [Rhodocyclaceae bacterium]